MKLSCEISTTQTPFQVKDWPSTMSLHVVLTIRMQSCLLLVSLLQNWCPFMLNINFGNLELLLLTFFGKSLACSENIEEAYGSFRLHFQKMQSVKFVYWDIQYSDRLKSWGWDRVRDSFRLFGDSLSIRKACLWHAQRGRQDGTCLCPFFSFIHVLVCSLGPLYVANTEIFCCIYDRRVRLKYL